MSQLPSSPDIERLIIGAVLLDGDLMDAMRTTIEPDDFSLELHRRVWDAMGHVYDAGARVELTSVGHELIERKQIQFVGGPSFLEDCMKGVPMLPSFERYVTMLKEKTTLRRMMVLAESIGKRCASGMETADELRAALSEGVNGLTATGPDSGPVSTREMIEREGLESLLQPRRSEGLRLPWTTLNDILCGLHGGQMITLGAGTGRGKTSFALQVAAHATRQGKSPVIWTMEMTPRQMFVRMINQLAFSDSDRARQGALTPQERERRKEAAYWLHGHPVWFDCRSRTIPAFCASVRQARAKSDVGLVIVDYLQLVRFAGRAESRTREVGENSRSLKLAALEFGLPFLVLSQFKRLNIDRDYAIHDFKESGDIENDSDVILIMNAGSLAGDMDVPVTVTIGKQREGPAGNDVTLIFHPPSQCFISPEER